MSRMRYRVLNLGDYGNDIRMYLIVRGLNYVFGGTIFYFVCLFAFTLFEIFPCLVSCQTFNYILFSSIYTNLSHSLYTTLSLYHVPLRAPNSLTCPATARLLLSRSSPASQHAQLRLVFSSLAPSVNPLRSSYGKCLASSPSPS